MRLEEISDMSGGGGEWGWGVWSHGCARPQEIFIYKFLFISYL